MRSLKSLFALIAVPLLAIGLVVGDADAGKNPIKFGGKAEANFGDLGFSRTDHAKSVENDTLTAALLDTTQSIPIAGASKVGFVWSITDADDGGNVSGHVLTFTPQVSIDGETNWQSLTTTFSASGSAGATATLYSQAFDLTVDVSDTTTLYDSTLDRLRTRNYLRMIVSKTNPAPEVDTVFVSGQYNVVY